MSLNSIRLSARVHSDRLESRVEALARSEGVDVLTRLRRDYELSRG